MSQEVMTIEEAAKYLDISESTLYKKVQAREIPYTKIGAALRFTKASIDAWLARNTVQPDDSLFEQFARLQNRYHFKMWLECRRWPENAQMRRRLPRHFGGGNRVNLATKSAYSPVG